MNLNTQNWKPFKVSALFTVLNGKGITEEEISDNPGNFVAVQSGEENNGVMGFIDLNYCKEKEYTYSEKPCLTVARSGTAGFVSFQLHGCVVGDSAKILLLDDSVASVERYVFLQTLLNANRYKYTYGRKVTETKYKNEILEVPAIEVEGLYVPDWQFMEDYIKSLHYKPLTTNVNIGHALTLNVQDWKYFLLKDICHITMGNKMDAISMTSEQPVYNFVGRSADNNGVAMKVDAVFDDNGNEIKPYPAGCVTVALGGSLGSTYLQKEPFYTSQNVSVLEFDSKVSDYAKLFLCTLIHNESLYKYFPFGRELNKYIKTVFGFTMPVLHDDNGNPLIDKTKKYSKEGFIPDWQFMEDYIKSLPYGDRLEG